MSVSILGVLGYSGCSRQGPETQTTRPVAASSSMPDAATHPHPEDVSVFVQSPVSAESVQPPSPTDLAIGSLKTPEALTEHQIEQTFSKARMLAATDPRKAQEQMHEISHQLGAGDPEWTEYFHLLGHSLIENPASPNLYMTLEDALRFDQLKLKLYGEDEEIRKEIERTQLKIQWNEDRDELNRQIQPIKDMLEWMSQSAPAEWAVVNPIYEETYSKERDALIPKDWLTDFLTPSERADIRYNAIFEALTYLPDDSLTFQEMLHTKQGAVPESFLEEKPIVETSPSEVQVPDPPVHTWDMVHDFSVPPNGLEATESLEDEKSLHPPVQGAGVLTEFDEKQAYEIMREMEKLFGEDFSFLREIQERRKYMKPLQEISPHDVPQRVDLYNVNPSNQFKGGSK